MAENVRDPIAARLRESVLGTAQEWLRRIDVPDTTYGLGDVEKSVVWMDDGTVTIAESRVSPAEHQYRVTVVVEPVDNWRPGTWREVALLVAQGDQDEVWVRLKGTEAQVASAGVVEWAVDPASNTYRPTPLAHAVVNIRLAGRDQLFTFPPDAGVEILSPPMGPALQTLLDSFVMEPVTYPDRPIMRDPR
jgi:hypothetical protein